MDETPTQSEHFNVQDSQSLPQTISGLVDSRFRIDRQIRGDKAIFIVFNTSDPTQRRVLKLFNHHETPLFLHETNMALRLNPSGTKVIHMLEHKTVEKSIACGNLVFEKRYSYIELPYCSQGDFLDFYIKLHKKRMLNRLSLEIKQFFFTQQVLCLVELHHLHGICHRDFKPENLILNADLTLSLIDFGHSCLMGETRTEVCGTKRYYPPELLFRGQPYEAEKVDIF